MPQQDYLRKCSSSRPNIFVPEKYTRGGQGVNCKSRTPAALTADGRPADQRGYPVGTKGWDTPGLETGILRPAPAAFADGLWRPQTSPASGSQKAPSAGTPIGWALPGPHFVNPDQMAIGRLQSAIQRRRIGTKHPLAQREEVPQERQFLGQQAGQRRLQTLGQFPGRHPRIRAISR
jgi:hypothetical protein